MCNSLEHPTQLETPHFYISSIPDPCPSLMNFSSLQVSAINSDQNENFCQFSGHHAFPADGYMSVLSPLAEDVNVELNCIVTNVKLERKNGLGMQVKVTDTNDNEYISDRVCAS